MGSWIDFIYKYSQFVTICLHAVGGSDVLANLMSHDENLFFLPSVSNVIKSATDFNKISHCTIPQSLVDYYKTHMGAALTSKSISKVGLIVYLYFKNLLVIRYMNHVCIRIQWHIFIIIFNQEHFENGRDESYVKVSSDLINC